MPGSTGADPAAASAAPPPPENPPPPPELLDGGVNELVEAPRPDAKLPIDPNEAVLPGSWAMYQGANVVRSSGGRCTARPSASSSLTPSAAAYTR